MAVRPSPLLQCWQSAEADHHGRTVEITERIVHRWKLRIAPAQLKPIYSDNARLLSGVNLQPETASSSVFGDWFDLV